MKSFDKFCYPVLKLMSDKKERKKGEICEILGANLTENDRNLLLKGGKKLYVDRIGWAISYLSYTKNLDDKNRLLVRVSRATYKITSLGLEISKNETKFSEWFNKIYNKSHQINEIQTPNEQIDKGIDDLNDDLKSELIEKILEKEPEFFEQFVTKLLNKMGYGYKLGETTQKTRDGGIDGVVNEDILGFSKIYFQAKRYRDNKVGINDIKQFVGTLVDKQTKKGLFITTSTFSDDAIKYANNQVATSLVLVDKNILADLMIKYKVGVQIKEIKEICQIDNDFFEGDE
ncbi:Mrr restriction system protein [Campylobacter sputorum subsp. bubulus]|uniref:Mrr restriction system protein n=1 Tax=Campylobacter sputorum subsp. sputorum TaxID=32024 RepID=A0A381DK08_9BACT|nr:restriction endonuclease [Campylobacter sputorum]ASM34359.1 Mrr family restriction endonuclease [Campylobacter sputorum aubsp. sputorum RM3237]KAB0582250.1 restriction endonuclease [Campylobacter sputorum subsp. sputorum]QEL04550.1 type IV methyl-directed restriction enzyme Mrr [Campylobacter sputorum subsp. sputorum]SUX09326.1 Mrr restriction system protein [Campylobacter sputorum subsp. bubulus]SUX11019.1 Mrr restriction system protein [Campylobacter sputorum subsp. sputorum]